MFHNQQTPNRNQLGSTLLPDEDLTLEKIKSKQRLELNERRKQRVFEKLCIKRCWRKDKFISRQPIPADQVRIVSTALLEHRSATSLQTLNQALSSGSQEVIDEFLSVGGALDTLIDCLTGHKADTQSQAAACIVNLAAGNHSSTIRIIKAAGPYLIAYLSGGSTAIQEISCWALGNMAADCQECCQILVVQGMPPALSSLLKSPNESVIEHSCFALGCYVLTTEHDNCCEVITPAVLSFFYRCLQDEAISHKIISEIANIIFYLSCRNEFVEKLTEAGLITAVVSKLALVANAEPDMLTIITPLTRALGNLVSQENVNWLLAHPNLGTLSQALLQSRYNHVKKEALWCLANIAAGGEKGAAFVCHSPFLKQVIQMAGILGEIGTQALICLCNASTFKASCEAIRCQHPYNQIANALHYSDTTSLILAMTLLFHLLVNSRATQVPKEMNICVQALYSLQQHKSPQINQMASYLLSATSAMERQKVLD